MAEEQTSVVLNTQGYEEPLRRLTTEMNAFNAASIAAAAQQRQLTRIMTGLGNVYASYARIMVQSAKAATIAVEGPSEALNKRFQNAQRVLANMGREVNKLQEVGKKVSNIPIIPKELDKMAKVFAAVEKRTQEFRTRTTKEMEQAREAMRMTEGAVPGVAKPIKADVAAAEAQKQAAIDEYEAKKRLMELNASYQVSLDKVTRTRQRSQIAVEKAAAAEKKAEIEKFEKQLAGLKKTEEESNQYWSQRQATSQKALEAEAQAVK